MKKILALFLAVFLLLSMTSCASISNLYDFIENTVPSIIASQIKDDIIPADTTAPQNSKDTSNTSPDAASSTAPPSLSTDESVDYAKLINTITTDTIKACVKITTTEYNSIYPPTPTKSSIGSGVIFKVTELSNAYHYYVLTNYHVAELSGNNPYYKYKITDYKGEEYAALTPSWLNDATMEDLCKEHDLAVLEFETTEVLNVIEMETENPTINETIISIGQPNGQPNAITFGAIEKYDDISIGDTFKPSFKVIAHNSPIDHGNSGGAILDTSLNLVGINFAGFQGENENFVNGYGIPIEIVRKFLSDFGITL